MGATSPIHRSYTTLGLLLIAASICGGCREKSPQFEVVSLEGSVEKVDVTSDDTGRITVSYYSEKRKQDVVGVGEVTKETEIMINGVAAKLADIRPGDRVRGEVRVEKKGKEKIQTALKIHVERPEPLSPRGE